MNCYQHPDLPATAFCRTCGRALCAADQREIYGVVYCQECLGRQLGHLPAGGAGEAATNAAANAPNPGIALLLGFIPSVGAIYNGQYLKAFLQVVVFSFLIVLSNNDWQLATLAGLGIAAFYFYMVIDSYRTAKAMAAGLPVDDLLGGARLPVNAPIAAIVLIAVGGLLLLRSLGIFHYDFSRYLWPVLLIAIGVGLLQRRGSWR